ncbi:hypothetical protein AQUCO_03000067v1 [Aquilegia coerulea]|uniref:Kinesin motor domain-containing protein n=1 Tax=Aquilegia coerulea TaxID=218851 RepID=A0A2G5D133_AQUCA|nr:hypothetical protein AQUCO_03000067v1 [Aquilegia coerulea]
MATTRGVFKLKSPLRSERQVTSVNNQSSLTTTTTTTNTSASAKSTSSNNTNGHPPPVRSKVPTSKRSITPVSRPNSNDFDNDGILHSIILIFLTTEPARVRVSVRVRPRNDEDLADADSYDCIELQPEVKRLKLRKNNWSSESYQFDEVFTESASQKRVYEVVAKPVVESVLNGFNGTVMAYGQTGTGKTHTVGRLGKEDPSECGIMVRAMKDILATSGSFNVEISYLQLYLESVQDLLLPEKNNIHIAEDSKTGEVSLPGAAVIKVRDLDHFLQLLQIGEANRHAANTKLNTESSRSHAILMVYLQKTYQGKAENEKSSLTKHNKNDVPARNGAPMLIKSKLLIVDLAGSERIDKSGSEGHMLEEAKFINLSLTSLGKCINALAENSPHIPTRDSKLTRLLRDSFGGSARTSLIITIGPSARNRAETASTIMFGQRAMKIVNMVKLKEEYDYESLCRKLENQVDHLTAELERQQKLREDDQKDMQKKLKDCRNSFAVVEKSMASRAEVLKNENSHLEAEINSLLGELKVQRDHNDLMHDEVAQLEMSLKQSKQNHLESSTYQKVLADTTQMYEKKIAKLIEELEDEHSRFENAEEQLNEMKKSLSDYRNSTEGQNEIDELRRKVQELCQLQEMTAKEVQNLKTENEELLSETETLYDELRTMKQRLSVEEKHRKYLEDEHSKLLKRGPESDGDFENIKSHLNGVIGEVPSGPGIPTNILKAHRPRETISGQRATVAKIFDEGKFIDIKAPLGIIISMLSSEDLEVQIHAVKVLANLAAEDKNQEPIVEEGGLEALLMLLGESKNATIHRVASGAIANLAMTEMNQVLIMSKGGAQLLANIASKTEDPQTLRMVAGALANLCGNQKLHVMLKEDGGIKALFRMVQSGNIDVIAQVARGMANFAKCESRETIHGHRKGRSLLLDDSALTWLIANSTSTSSSTRRHIELALCHLAQNDENAQDFVFTGAVKVLVRISCESSKEDIRNLARKILNLNPLFRTETKTM